MARDSLAQDDRYRVELLVLTHLNEPPEPREAAWIKDYSTALDFLIREEPKEAIPDPCAEELIPEVLAESPLETGAADAPGAEQPLPGEPSETDAPEAEEAEPDPNAVFPVTEMSDTMQEAWRRLRLSAPFRPEQYLSWEQGSNEPFPVLRLHDQEVVDSDDPYARERFERELAAAEAALEAEAGSEHDQQPECAPDIPPDEPPAEPELPDSKRFYRLDGSVVLRRSRFLHLDLDLQLREAVFEEIEASPAGDRIAASASPPGQPAPGSWDIPEADQRPVFVPPLRPSSFLVHGLEQSRQVRTGRMEYFDGPALGVLALITRIEPEKAEDGQR